MCLPCPQTQPLWYNSSCRACSNVWPALPWWSGSFCQACPQDSPYYFAGDLECHQKCPESAPAQDEYGYCKSCNESTYGSRPFWHPYNETCVRECTETGVNIWNAQTC